MTDDIKWGAPIAVDGKRPDWLADDVIMQWHDKDEDWLGGGQCDTVESYCDGSFDEFTTIRLPADHEYYTRPQKPAPAYPPELVERMIAFVRSHRGYDDVADSILSELEPKDPDVELAREICATVADGFIGEEMKKQAYYYLEGMNDDEPCFQFVVAAIKRVREGG